MPSTSMLKTCFDVMHYSGAAAVLRPFFAGQGAIFCLHQVYPGGGHESGFAPNARLAITPAFLSDIISLVKSLRYELLSLERAAARLRQGGIWHRPFAVFTLDDGYKDNLVHALPVFRRHRCPFTVFVTTRMADGHCEMWWRVLEQMIAGSASVKVEMAGNSYSLDTGHDGQKIMAWNILAPVLKSMPEHEQRAWTQRWAEKSGIDAQALCRSSIMDWDEIRTLNAEPLASIGAHTLNHFNLLKLDEGEAKREIEQSRKRIEEELGEAVRTFAYPYGNTDAAGPREFRLAAEAGFDVSVTTRHGIAFEGHAQHLQALPRIMVSGRFQKSRYVETLLSGVPAALVNRFQRVNVA
jgi:peptidoglycan/xylan/chitin deacetylase (PgdA/CDA1 family)